MVGPEDVDRGVVQQPTVLVQEGRVADPSGPIGKHVVGNQAVGGAQRIGPVEIPLDQGRAIPDPGSIANGRVLGVAVAEAGGPQPAVPIAEFGAELLLDVMEGRVDGRISHGWRVGAGRPGARRVSREARRPRRESASRGSAANEPAAHRYAGQGGQV